MPNPYAHWTEGMVVVTLEDLQQEIYLADKRNSNLAVKLRSQKRLLIAQLHNMRTAKKHLPGFTDGNCPFCNKHFFERTSDCPYCR